jgi:hypothetical protein
MDFLFQYLDQFFFVWSGTKAGDSPPELQQDLGQIFIVACISSLLYLIFIASDFIGISSIILTLSVVDVPPLSIVSI